MFFCLFYDVTNFHSVAAIASASFQSSRLIIHVIIWQSKFERSDWFFLGRDFAIRTVSVETVISCVYFLFSKAGKFKTSMARMPYNKLLTNLASSSRTGEYWPSVVSVRTSLRSVRTATTSGHYSPVRPSRSVSKRLVFLLYTENISQLLTGEPFVRLKV